MANVKISDLTAASSVADANQFEINESGTSKRVTASQIKSYATNSTSVTAAGALMDSELADVAAVKGINQALTTTSTPTFAGVNTTGDISFGDGDIANFGSSNDLQVYHTGSSSNIKENGTGNLNIWGDDTVFYNSAGSEVKAKFLSNGAAELYYDNSKKFQTSSVGSQTDQLFGISDADTGIALGANGANIMQLYTGNSERLRVDENGQVGIGATSLTRELTVKKNDQCDVSIVAATNQSAQLLFGDTDADNRGIIQYDNASDSMAFTVAGSERMHIGSSGKVGINEASPSSALHVKDGAGANIGIQSTAGSHWRLGDGVGSSNGTFVIYDYTNSAARLAIESTGRQSNVGNVSGNVAKFENQHSTAPSILWLHMSGASPDSNSDYFVYAGDTTTLRCVIWSDGDIDNHDNSYGGTSDQKLKQQITDASSQWDDIKALQVRKFKFNSDVETGDSDEHWRLGVIAQEVEASGMSGLVNDRVDKDEDGNALETTTKSVKYSVLYMKAVKALQEAMARIETLETENVEIKARLDALEAE